MSETTRLSDHLLKAIADYGHARTEVQRLQAWETLVGCIKEQSARESAAWKWGYEYLQGRMESIGREGWAHDCDDEIAARIAAQ